MDAQPVLSLGLDDAQRGRLLPVLGEPLDRQRDIEYLDIGARSVLNPPASTGIGCWTINPYVGCAFGCAYCYARYAHRYVMERAHAESEAMPAWLAFERRVLVKRDAPALVRRALASGSARYQPLVSGAESLLIGSATDPYQPAERRFRLTRGVLEALAEHRGIRAYIITKSPLVTRDVDVLACLTERGKMSVHVSLITLDRALARRLEPRAPTPESRLRAIERLAKAGIAVGVNVMPVLPGITDDPAALDRLFAASAAAGARDIGTAVLRLQPAARDRYLPFIATEFPALASRYRIAYATSWDASARYRDGLRACTERLAAKHGLRTRVYDRDSDTRKVPDMRAAAQLSLGIG